MPETVATASLPLNTGATHPAGRARRVAGAARRRHARAVAAALARRLPARRHGARSTQRGRRRAAVRESGVPRGEVFVTTKLWNDDQGYDAALRAFDAQPRAARPRRTSTSTSSTGPSPRKRLDSWRALERLFDEKRARAIGVSNFLMPHLEELLAHGARRPGGQPDRADALPAATRHVALCREHGIVVEAYSPLDARHAPRASHGAVDVARLAGTNAGAGAAALGRAARLRRAAEVGHARRASPRTSRSSTSSSTPRRWPASTRSKRGSTTGWDPAEQR